MGEKLQIAILIHERTTISRASRYIVKHLWQTWEEWGHTVRVDRGVQGQAEADIVFVHLDCTVMPDEYLEYAARFPAAINGLVRSISKETFSALLLNPEDDWPGRVIVKTKANYGGHTDLDILESHDVTLATSGDYERPWRKREVLDPYDYPVFGSINKVPSGVWRNPNLIVEKFVPELDEEGRHVVREWGFLGDQEFTIRKFSPYHIVKSRDGERRPERHCAFERSTDPVPSEARALRQKMGLDFGRLDYVEVDGRGHVFDVNTTPAMGRDIKATMLPELRGMAEAINSFL